MKGNEEIEVLTSLEEEKDKKIKKNSVILIFAVVGAILSMFIIAAVLFLAPMVYSSGNKNTSSTIIKKKSTKVSSQYKLNSNSLEEFDLSFLRLENNGKNEVYSPLSIKYALAMLSEGSNGTTKDQIDSVLGKYKVKKYSNNEHMSFANAIFIRNSFKDRINKEFTKSLNNKYNAEVIVDGFDNASNMNNWVSDKTFKLINNLFDDETVSNENFILTNALAIDMDWKNLLQCASTTSDTPCMPYNVSYQHENYSDYVSYIDGENYPVMNFNDNNNVKSVKVAASVNKYDIVKSIGEENIKDAVGAAYKKWLEEENIKDDDLYYTNDVDVYLNNYIEDLKSNYKKIDKSTDFMLYSDEELNIFAKDLKEYDSTNLQYVAVMPKQVPLKEFISNIDKKKMQNIISKLKEIKLENFDEGFVTKINGNIPLFKFSYSLNLIDDLKYMGVNDAFDIGKSDFTSMIGNETRQCIDSASHRATIEFSNEGIKAAAATDIGGAGGAKGGFEYLFDVPVKEIDINFNKPYMFIIRDKNSGEVWFVGSVYEPIVK